MAGTFGSYDAKNKCRVFLFSVGNEWREHSAPYDAKNKCWVFSLASEMNGGNIRPYDAKNKCRVLSLASEMNGGNIRLRMTQFPSDHMPVSVYKPHPRLLIFFGGKKVRFIHRYLR